MTRHSPASQAIRDSRKPKILHDTEADAKSVRFVRKGLNKPWFCGKCGGYHPKGQVVCDGKRSQSQTACPR